MRIGVAGMGGRMGRLVVAAAGDQCVGGTPGREATAPQGAPLFPDIEALAAAADVVVDFTHPDLVARHAAALAAAGTAWVLGTTGLADTDQVAVRAASVRIPIVQAANFSPGVNLVLALAARLAALLPADTYDAEILEMHHRRKVDAPSGTALALGEAVARARGVGLAEVAARGRNGQVGARPTGEIGFAALRGGAIVGEHALTFTSDAEQITLAHRAFDRSSFAIGAVRAALWTQGRAPGLYSMMDVLGMTAA